MRQTNKLKIYMAGSGGMLGEAFYRVFNEDFQLKCTRQRCKCTLAKFSGFQRL